MDIRIGARFRGLRHRRGWTQAQLAARAIVSQDVVSLIERGRLERVSLANLRAVAQALDAEFYVQLRWRGGDLDRLMDEGHATLVGQTADLLRERGWQVRAEVSYSIYGERGSIDLLGWHEATRTLLVIEVKTDVVSVEETLRKHDEKVRLAGRIAAEQFGWRPQTVGRLLSCPVLRHRDVGSSATRPCCRSPIRAGERRSGRGFACPKARCPGSCSSSQRAGANSRALAEGASADPRRDRAH